MTAREYRGRRPVCTCGGVAPGWPQHESDCWLVTGRHPWDVEAEAERADNPDERWSWSEVSLFALTCFSLGALFAACYLYSSPA